jgi:23S rRNA pseudouridine1911/1915/1917 synthase
MTPAPTGWTVDPRAEGRSLQDFLAERLQASRNKAKELIDSRNVIVNGRRVWMARHRLVAGDRVELAAGQTPLSPAAEDALRPLVEDGGILVVSKPPGLLTTGPGSLETRVREARKNSAWRAVHRLDRDTSGCVLMTDDDGLFDALVERFRAREILKVYHVIVKGHFAAAERTLHGPIEGQEAITRLRRLDAGDFASHLSARIETGRTHQIRRHLADAGFPVLGDRLYGPKKVDDRRLMSVPRQMLHASVLEFPHPRTDRRMRAEAPMPPDFRACLRAFKLT